MNSLSETTQRQLHLISDKTDRLEGTLASEVGTVKQLRRARDECVGHVESLQEQLRIAQQRANDAVAVHDEATLQLKVTAAEYGKAQLLRKKYQNTVDELAGHCRAIVTISGGADQTTFVVADEVTLNVPGRNKQFVVDAVLPLDDPPMETSSTPNVEEMFLTGIGFSLQSMIGDVVGGTSASLISFGPSGSGKSTLMFGDRSTWSPHHAPSPSQSIGRSESQQSLPNTGSRFGVHPTQQHRFGQHPTQNHYPSGPLPPLQGIVPLFLSELLRSLEVLDVTHFNMRLSFAELHHDAIYDLLGDFSHLGGGGGHQHTVSPAVPVSCLADVRLSPFHTAAEAHDLLRTGLSRLQTRKKSHVIVTAAIENFDARGHYRKANATFVDLAGCTSSVLSGEGSPAQQQGMVPSNPDQLWVDKSMLLFLESLQAVAVTQQQQLTPADVSAITLLTAANRSSQGGYGQHPVGHRRAGNASTAGPGRSLLALLDPLVGGGANCKTTMLVALNCSDRGGGGSSEQELLAALAQGFIFKSVINSPVPYDIPAELQRLQDEMNDF